MVFVKKPAGANDWDACVRRACSKMENVRDRALGSGAFQPEDLDHRRGEFLAINAGVSFGGGATVRGASLSAGRTWLIARYRTGTGQLQIR